MTGFRTHRQLHAYRQGADSAELERKATLARQAECDNEIARMFASERDAEEHPVWFWVAAIVCMLAISVLFGGEL
jgi:hypothetical protein